MLNAIEDAEEAADHEAGAAQRPIKTRERHASYTALDVDYHGGK